MRKHNIITQLLHQNLHCFQYVQPMIQSIIGANWGAQTGGIQMFTNSTLDRKPSVQDPKSNPMYHTDANYIGAPCNLQAISHIGCKFDANRFILVSSLIQQVVPTPMIVNYVFDLFVRKSVPASVYQKHVQKMQMVGVGIIIRLAFLSATYVLFFGQRRYVD